MNKIRVHSSDFVCPVLLADWMHVSAYKNWSHPSQCFCFCFVFSFFCYFNSFILTLYFVSWLDITDAHSFWVWKLELFCLKYASFLSASRGRLTELQLCRSLWENGYRFTWFMSTASTFLLSLWSQSLGQVLLNMTPSSFCKLWSLVWCAHIKHEAVTLKVYAENCRTSSEKLKVSLFQLSDI